MVCPYNHFYEVDTVSLQRCILETVVVCLHNQIYEFLMVSSMSLKRCVAVSGVDLALAGSVINGANPSSFLGKGFKRILHTGDTESLNRCG